LVQFAISVRLDVAGCQILHDAVEVRDLAAAMASRNADLRIVRRCGLTAEIEVG
jgi:hypothetical protein